MTPEEQVAAKKIARIMRSARKLLALNQQTVATRLGVSQSALSKLEHGVLVPSAPQWFEFCKLTNIAENCFLNGYIDKNKSASLEDGNRVGTFKLPRKYSVYRGSKVRALLPFLAYLRAEIGEKKKIEFFKSKKVDPDFFVTLDNQISIEFSLDIARYLIAERLLKPDDLSKLIKPVGQADFHGALHADYASHTGPAALLSALILNARQYECNFIYKVEEHKKNIFVFSVEAEKHLQKASFRSDPILGDFVCKYRKSYFERFALYGDLTGKKNIEIQEIECSAKGAPKCVYRIELPSS